MLLLVAVQDRFKLTSTWFLLFIVPLFPSVHFNFPITLNSFICLFLFRQAETSTLFPYKTDFLSYSNSTKIAIFFSRQTFCWSVTLFLGFVSLADHGFVNSFSFCNCSSSSLWFFAIRMINVLIRYMQCEHLWFIASCIPISFKSRFAWSGSSQWWKII